MIRIYTDGAYSSNRDQGGYAFVILNDNAKIHSYFSGVKNTTNNRMEIRACMEACQWCKNNNILEFILYTDSMYVIGTMSKNWKRNKNNDLWDEFDKLVEGLIIHWTHVKGHEGDKYNELCDALAVEGSHAIL